jgi:hypothetical protein
MVSEQDLWISKSLLILIGSFIIFSVVGIMMMRVITPTAVLINGLLRYIPGKGRFISRSVLYSKRLDNIEEILNRIVVEDYERRKQDDERRKQDDERRTEVRKLDEEEHRKIRRSLTDFIGYVQPKCRQDAGSFDGNFI